uniref:Uncharacterized protein n=2 Tax=Cyprinus carpio TaxID=7962 RepID=A0A8C1D601_CYPCA
TLYGTRKRREKWHLVTVDDKLIIPEGEEDLETDVKAVVDNFLRNYLVQMGMKRTSDCFQIEWFEMGHKGLMKTDVMQLVSDVYTHNQLLDNELKNVQRERNSYKRATFEGGETIVKLQRERDFHSMHQKHVVQEKNRLFEDIKKVYATCDPALRQLNEKYQAAVWQKMLVSLERDKAVSQVQITDSSLCTAHSFTGTRTALESPKMPHQREKNTEESRKMCTTVI